MRSPFVLLLAVVVAAVAGGCSRPAPTGYQGYLEAEFVYVAPPLAGQLEKLAVAKGTHLAKGVPLFTLERSAEIAAQQQAADQLRAAQARVEDLKKGSRPSELATLEARLAQAKSAAELSRLDLARQEDLFKTHVISQSDIDRVRLNHTRDTKAVDELTADLETARLGARPDAIAGAEADVKAATAAKERADWSVDQKAQAAPAAGFVFDTLFREGEFVGAGQPVVILLPPENLKARFFVTEDVFGRLKAGDTVHVHLDGRDDRIPPEAHITYLSPQPEYTPPVLYNRENRSKLVFMVEATFTDLALARDLHPGQPIDVWLAATPPPAPAAAPKQP